MNPHVRDRWFVYLGLNTINWLSCWSAYIATQWMVAGMIDRRDGSPAYAYFESAWRLNAIPLIALGWTAALTIVVWRRSNMPFLIVGGACILFWLVVLALGFNVAALLLIEID
jgi:hypothetical protein